MRPSPTPSGGLAHRLLYATEPGRALFDAGGLVVGLPLLRRARHGDRHPVLVLPGLLASDASTAVLRRWLTRLEYQVVGWDLGRNLGPTQAVVDGLPTLLERLADRHGQPVSLVGWSLGGIFARKLALRRPDLVRQVITLGSPFGAVEYESAGTPGERMYQRLAHLHVTDRIYAPNEATRGVLPVPSSSVYSHWDGIVDWRACVQPVGPTSENIPVRASHLGIGHHPAVLWIVADRLAQPQDDWRPFTIPVGINAVSLFGGVPKQFDPR